MKHAAFKAWLTVSRGLWHFGDMADRSACIPWEALPQSGPGSFLGWPIGVTAILVIPAPSLQPFRHTHSATARRHARVSHENESSCDLAALGRFQTRAISELATRLTREAGELIRGEEVVQTRGRAGRTQEQERLPFKGPASCSASPTAGPSQTSHRRKAAPRSAPTCAVARTASRMRYATAAVAPRVCA